MQPRFIKVSMVSSVALSSLMMIGCPDPQKTTTQLLLKQGLVLLEPTRDYVKVGALVVLNGNAPTYVDPLDPLPPTSPVSSFNAIIPAQTMQDSTKISLALNGLGAIVALPIGLQVNLNQSIKMGQVDTGGTRLESPKIDAVLQLPNTNKRALGLLQDKRNRVFVIQEVYTAKSLTVTSAGGGAVEASYGGAGSLPDCTPASGDSSNQSKTPAATDKNGKPAGGATTSGASAPKLSSPQAGKTGTGNKTTAAAASALSVSVGACHSTDGSLTFTNDKAIPFAVRLNELQDNSGILNVKYGPFRFPTKALGNDEDAKRTAIPEQVLEGLPGR